MVVPKALTALKKLINSAVDARLLTSLSGPTAVMESFNLQFFMMRREHSSLQLAHRCLPEVRIVFRGTVACAGVRLSVLAGNTLREKCAAFANYDIESFMKLTKETNDAFLVVMHPGQMLITPASFLMCQIVLEEAAVEGLRWSFMDESSKREIAAANDAIDLLVTDHPVSKDDVLSQLLDRMSCD